MRSKSKDSEAPRSSRTLTSSRIEDLRAVILADRENFPSKVYEAEINALCDAAKAALSESAPRNGRSTDDYYGQLARERGDAYALMVACDEIDKLRAPRSMEWPTLCENCGENLREEPTYLRPQEAAWLIESGAKGSRPYWWGRTPGYVTRWTDDANKAIRFSRKEDAEAAIALIDESPPPKATEHVWLGAQQQTDVPEGCTPADAQLLRKANGDLAQENHQLRRTLRFYANGGHYTGLLHWEGPSGDDNWLCPPIRDDLMPEDRAEFIAKLDEAMVEDGSLAASTLRGKYLEVESPEDEPKVVRGEPEWHVEQEANRLGERPR